MNDRETRAREQAKALPRAIKMSFRISVLISVPLGVMYCFIIPALVFTDTSGVSYSEVGFAAYMYF